MKKFKNIFALCLSLVLIFSVMSVSFVASAASGKCGDNVYYTLDNGTLTISGEGKMTDYIGDLGYKLTSEVSYDRYWLSTNYISELAYYNSETGIISFLNERETEILWQFNTKTDEVKILYGEFDETQLEEEQEQLKYLAYSMCNEPMPRCEWKPVYIGKEDCPNLCTDWYIESVAIEAEKNEYNLDIDITVSEDGKYIYMVRDSYEAFPDEPIESDDENALVGGKLIINKLGVYKVLIRVDGYLYNEFPKLSAGGVFHAPLGHTDLNKDGYCDVCMTDLGTDPSEPPTEPSNPSDNCSCNCHKNGIINIFWEIANFFHKLFGMKQYRYCNCGIAHW